jgi:hypothetical protein
MGIAQAGIAFKATSTINNLSSFVSRLFNENANKIEHPNFGEFDIRSHTDVMVQFFNDSCFICNHDLVWDFLENQEKDITPLYQKLGCPELIVIFCHYDSGGSYGYSIVEQGKRTRTRLQIIGERLFSLIESGLPTELESRWLSAKFYVEEDDCPIEERQKIYFQDDPNIEFSEYCLTMRMLYEILLLHFSVCPWETDIEPEYHFFKLKVTKKPWWKLW